MKSSSKVSEKCTWIHFYGKYVHVWFERKQDINQRHIRLRYRKSRELLTVFDVDLVYKICLIVGIINTDQQWNLFYGLDNCFPLKIDQEPENTPGFFIAGCSLWKLVTLFFFDFVNRIICDRKFIWFNFFNFELNFYVVLQANQAKRP